MLVNMERGVTRREQTSSRSRELILRAAAELFAQRGYRQTTFVDIAERSGISRGSIPWHFGSKEGLLLAVLEKSLDALNERFAKALDLSAESGLEVFMVGLGDLFTSPTARLFVTLLAEAQEPGAAIHAQYVALHDALRGLCRRWLERFAPDRAASSPGLATAIIGAGIGIRLQWSVAPEKVDLQQSLAALRELVTAMLSPTAGS